MKRIIFLLFFLSNLTLLLHAQDTTASADATNREDVYPVRVLYESAFVRQLPAEDSDPAASVFENDVLQAIGRNADGSWLQVRRPGRDISLGWIAKRLVVFTFDITRLPITDLTTGVTGTEPLFDSGVSVFILTEANLRSEPLIDSPVIGIIPIAVTIPAIERNFDERWVKVNYLGTVGWVNSFNISTTNDLTSLPIDERYSPVNPDYPAIVIPVIPPEVQLEQVYRMLDYLDPISVTVGEVLAFWSDLQEGLTIVCNPPQAYFTPIEITTQDLYELPELRTAARRLQRGLDDLNASIAAMQRCGVYTPREISEHYAQAINASIVISSVRGRVRDAERLLLGQLGQVPNP
jgi:hypothetical protein